MAIGFGILVCMVNLIFPQELYPIRFIKAEYGAPEEKK